MDSDRAWQHFQAGVAAFDADYGGVLSRNKLAVAIVEAHRADGMDGATMVAKAYLGNKLARTVAPGREGGEAEQVV